MRTGGAPYSCVDVAPAPDSFAGAAGAGQGAQTRSLLGGANSREPGRAVGRLCHAGLRSWHATCLSFRLDEIYDWCAWHGLDPFAGGPRAEARPLPLYVTHLAESGRAVASIRVALAAIATAYRLAGLALDLRDPKLAPVVEGITRTLGLRPRRQPTPAVPELLRAMLVQCRRDEIFRRRWRRGPRHAAARFWRGACVAQNWWR